MSKKDVYTVRRVPRTWTSNKEYEILKGRKVVLKLSDRSEADAVCKYLNTLPSEPAKKSTKKKTTKSTKSAKQDKLEGDKSEWCLCGYSLKNARQRQV